MENHQTIEKSWPGHLNRATSAYTAISGRGILQEPHRPSRHSASWGIQLEPLKLVHRGFKVLASLPLLVHHVELGTIPTQASRAPFHPCAGTPPPPLIFRNLRSAWTQPSAATVRSPPLQGHAPRASFTSPPFPAPPLLPQFSSADFCAHGQFLMQLLKKYKKYNVPGALENCPFHMGALLCTRGIPKRKPHIAHHFAICKGHSSRKPHIASFWGA